MSNDSSRQSLPAAGAPASTADHEALFQRLCKEGLALRAQGRPAEALQCYRQALALKPNSPEVHNFMGNALMDQGSLEEAIQSFRNALALIPNAAVLHNNLASALIKLNRFDEALACYERSLALEPNAADTRKALGDMYLGREILDAAAAQYEKALALDPKALGAANNLGAVYNTQGKYEQAAQCFRRVIALNPQHAEALKNLGDVLFKLQGPASAEEWYRKALQVRPDYAGAQQNLAKILMELCRFDEAHALYAKLVELFPDDHNLRLSLGYLDLIFGNLLEGFKAYEHRFYVGDINTVKREFNAQPWDGTQDLRGKSLLLSSEQGIGDTLQMLRYLPWLAEKGAEIFLEVRPSLKALLSSLPHVKGIFGKGDALPAFDYQCSFMSLPFAFGTTLDSIPPIFHCVQAKPALQERIRKALGAADVGDALRVGVSWKGSATYAGDAQRSAGLAPFKRLFQLDGVKFFSLMPDSRAEFYGSGPACVDLGWELDMDTGAFEETAALIAGLDLVITVDTSIGHLASLLGKPVWTTLPFQPDWRWMIGREDSPWYPQVRLFRQVRNGDWDELFERVEARLREVIAGTSPILCPPRS